MTKDVYKKGGGIFIFKIFFSFIAILMLLIISYSFINNYLINKQVNQEIKEIQTKISDLKTENIELEELIKYFDSQAYVELKARSELSMRKEGEEVVVIDNQTLPASEIVGALDYEQELSNPKKWFSYLFIK